MMMMYISLGSRQAMKMNYDEDITELGHTELDFEPSVIEEGNRITLIVNVKRLLRFLFLSI